MQALGMRTMITFACFFPCHILLFLIVVRLHTIDALSIGTMIAMIFVDFLFFFLFIFFRAFHFISERGTMKALSIDRVVAMF